jgi:hypothetical protein
MLDAAETKKTRRETSLPRNRDTSLPRKSQREKTEPEISKPATKDAPSSSQKTVYRRPIPHSISHIFKNLSATDQEAMLKTIYKEGQLNL